MKRCKKRSIIIFFLLIAVSLNSVFAGSNVDLERGIKLFDAEEYAEAKKIFTDVADKHSDNPEAWYFLGRLCLIDDDFDKAIEYLKKAVKLNQKSSEYHHWLGIAYGKKIDKVSKIKLPFIAMKFKSALEKAVELDADNIQARLDLMGYYLNAPVIGGGSKEKANEQATEIKKRDPEVGKKAFFNIYISQAGSYIDKKDFEKAYQILVKIVKDYPEEKLPYCYIGYIGFKSGSHLEEAEKNMQICINMLSSLETDLEAESETEKRWKSRIHVFHYMLGTIYEKNGKKDLAKKEYETALIIDPDYKEAKEALNKL